MIGRILNVTEIKTVPEVPLSHPFVERLVGTIRRELLDQIPFWGAQDLERLQLDPPPEKRNANQHQPERKQEDASGAVVDREQGDNTARKRDQAENRRDRSKPEKPS